jgi:hypothetical protein
MHDVITRGSASSAIDFNVTEEGKVMEMVSESVLQMTFRKPPLVFWYSIKR